MDQSGATRISIHFGSIRASTRQPKRRSMSGAGGRNLAREARWTELYREGLTLRSIAGLSGVCMQRVHQVLVRAGEPLRSRGYRSPPDHCGWVDTINEGE